MSPIITITEGIPRIKIQIFKVLNFRIQITKIGQKALP
jgi:hypothetical protein